jgi:glutathione S-transferase|tara:strand:+ start:597 stop:1091 length:495 start_codon:yes stop_codon:yes gene_type:complete
MLLTSARSLPPPSRLLLSPLSHTRQRSYLAHKFNINEGKTLKDIAKSEELIEASCDIHSMLNAAQYGADRTVAMDAIFAADGGKAHKILSAYEPTVLASGFFCSAASAGDLAFAAGLNLMVRLEADVLSAYPNIAAMYAQIHANADVAEINARCPYPYFKRNSD